MDKKFSCRVCESLFSTEKALLRHIDYVKDNYHNRLLYNDSNRDEWVECKICGYRRGDLKRHINSKHDITVKEYIDRHDSETAIKKMKEQFENCRMKGSKTSVRDERKKYICFICNAKFLTKNRLQKHFYEVQDKDHSQVIYNDSNRDEWVQCKICDYRAKRLDYHIKLKHSELTVMEYKEKYKCEILSEEYLKKTRQCGQVNHESDKYKGENNPFYGKHHSIETKQSISKTLLSKKDKTKAKKILRQQTEKIQNQEFNLDNILDKF